MIYGFGAIGDIAIGVAPIGGNLSIFWDESEPPVVVDHRRRKRQKFYTRERDNLNIYWQADDIDLKLEPEKPKRKEIKVVKRPVEPPKAKPDEVVPLAQIEALAREYDEMQAYQRAMQQKQWAQLARLYERLQDEADVEFLLAYA
jgi:hypothetical protein